MKDEIWEFILYTVAAGIILALILFGSGCSMFQPGTSTDPIKPGTELLVKTVLKTNWLMTVAIIGVGAGFFSFLNGNGKGLKIMAACFVILSLVLAISQYAAWIAGIAMVGAVALMIYTTVIRNKALTEIVKGGERIQIIDGKLSDTAINFRTVQRNIQSLTTKKLVNYIRKNLK